MKIGFASFGESWNTMGLEIVCNEIERNFSIKPKPATIETAKDFDIMLFSLYWWEHKYDYIKYIKNAGIIPKNKKPYLILGGMEMMNPKPLSSFFDYAIIGDGEDVITELINDIISKREPTHESIWVDGRSKNNCKPYVKKSLYAMNYMEDRTNKLSRVEIARGCKKKCLFCMISFVKPYRELPSQAVKTLIQNSPTNRIALFSPDTGSYSDYELIEYWVKKYKKTNMGTDLRLDIAYKKKTASALRFGIEAFTEKCRMAIGKPYSNEKLITYFDHIANTLQKTKGGRLTVATVYMILGLPGERDIDYSEFNETLSRMDAIINKKFTLFLTLNGFSPQNFTPLQFASIDPFVDYTKKWNAARSRHKKLVIAQHGGSRNSSAQILQMLTIRGDEKMSKLMYNLSVNSEIKRKAIGKSLNNGKYLLDLIKSQGMTERKIIGELKIEDKLPWDEINNDEVFSKEKLYKMYQIYKRRVFGEKNYL